MRNQTPLVPSQPAFDGTVYIVLNYFGSRLARAYCEDEADESTTIENILSGQFSHPLGVVAFNTAEGWRVMRPRTLPVPYSTEPRRIVQSEKAPRSFWSVRLE
jgi:hypothetical protein